jgi:hypothetical protein
VSRRQLTKARQPQRKRSPQPSTEKTPQQSVRPAPKRWLWIIAAIAVVLIGFGFWRSSSGNVSLPASSTVVSSSAITPTPTWQTVQSFNGSNTNNVYQKTSTFQVSDNWQITWTCQGINGVDESLIVTIYNPDGSLYNAGAEITCLAIKEVVGSVQESKGGTYYLAIEASTDWTVHVQVEK